MFRKKSALILIGINILFLAVSLALAISGAGKLTYPSIIHFDKWNGVNFLGDESDFWGIFLTGVAFTLMNAFLALKLFYKERVTAYLFLAANILISILLLIFSATVIGNN